MNIKEKNQSKNHNCLFENMKICTYYCRKTLQKYLYVELKLGLLYLNLSSFS